MRSRSLRRNVGWWAGAVAASLCGLAAAAPVPAQLAWGNGEGVVAVQRSGETGQPVDVATLRTPLGSVWKLFVYAYLVGNDAHEPEYRCTAADRRADDDYCCDPGGSVARDEALARSCGPYFEAARIGIAARPWARYWQAQEAPSWLQQLPSLRPETELPVADLLQALQHVPAPARLAARRALLEVSVRDDTVLAALGSGPRFKTWSWHVGAERAGGAAGWLGDATPFWFGAPGTSRSALHNEGAWMAAQWAQRGALSVAVDAAARNAEPCIDVDFYARYPLHSVSRRDGSAAPAGTMRGRYTLAFVNGSRLVVDATPSLSLQGRVDAPAIVGRLSLEDYVARVVDREGVANEVAAARALAVVARSYVLQNASEDEGCRHIADSSRTQRVGASPPSAAAQAAAAFTDGLVLDGLPVHFHDRLAGPTTMAWSQAVAASRSGTGFEAILRESFPTATLGAARAGSDCLALPQAEAWLGERQRRWRGVLHAETGYEAPTAVHICQLALGTPHSDQRRLVIRIREWQSRDGRVTLIHEYLHLAFRNHPRGADEVYVERMAQKLADL